MKYERIANVGGGSPASRPESIDLVSEISGRDLSVRYERSERDHVRGTAGTHHSHRPHSDSRPASA